MRRYSLHPYLSYALVEGDLIFLDTSKDCYFEVDRRLRADLADLERCKGELSAAAAAQMLDADLIRVDADGRTAATRGQIPTAGLDSFQSAEPPPLRELAEIGGLVGAAALRLRLGHLKALLDQLTAPGTEADPAAVQAAARRFDALRRHLPWRRRCLPDSLALAWFLKRRSLSATLVIGVTVAPFSAHCWVQDKTQILNDSADTVAGFTPILVVPS